MIPWETNYFLFHKITKCLDILVYPMCCMCGEGGGGGGVRDVAKVSCILRHPCVQLILAYSWAVPAVIVAGKGRVFFLFLLFLPFHSCSSFFPVPLFHLLYYLFYLFSPFLLETTQKDPQGLMCRKPQHN